MMKPLQSYFGIRCLWVSTCLISSMGLTGAAIGQESTPAALNVYTDAAGFQNGGQYDLAADEWEKFLKQFAKDPLFKKAQHYAGVCRLQLKQYAKAAAHFEQVVKDPKFEQVEDAYLNLAWSQYSLGRQDKPEMYPQAVATFTKLVQQFPKGKYTDQALYYLGESHYAQGKKKEAVAAYKKLVEAHKKSTLRCDGLYAMGVTLEELADYPQAGTTYDVFIKECAESPLITEVRMRKAETVLQAGDFPKAAAQFAAVAAVNGFAAADHAIYRQAFCVTKQDKDVEAGTLYAKLATDFPESVYLEDALISAGRSFLRGKKTADAEKWLQATIKADGKTVGEAGHWLCRLYMGEKEYLKASQLAKTLLPKAAESPFFVDLKLDEADALYEVPATRPAALAKYLEIAAAHAEHRLAPQSLYNAAFTSLDLKKFDEGRQHADAFLAKFSDDVLAPDAKSVAAECSLQLNDLADAETRFQELVSGATEHAEIDNWTVRLGLVTYLQKKYPETIALLTPALKTLTVAENLAEANFLIGGSHLFQKKYVEAEAAFANSLKAKPEWRKSDEVWLLRSRSERARGEFELARKSVAHVLADFPDSKLVAEANYRLGEYSYAAGEFPAAAKAYAEVITKSADSPFVPFALYGKGWAHLKAQQYQESIDEFAALIAKHAGHELVSDAHFGRAMCLRQLSKYEPAIADIAVYLKSDLDVAKTSDAFYERGQCEVGLKDYDAAITTFTALLKADPKYANASGVLYELGWALKNTEKEADAVKAFARIVAEHPESSFAAEANFHVGESQYASQDLPAAVKSYTAAKQKSNVATLSEQATHKLGWTYYRQGKFTEALAEFDEQLQAHAEGALLADAAFMRGECLFKAKKYAEALAAFTEARKTLPKSEAMQVLLLLHGGQSAAQVEKWDQGNAFLEPIPKQYPKTPLLAEVLFERGRTRQNLSQLDPALEDFNQASLLSRTEIGARSRFMIGEIEFQKKEYEAAVSTFRKVMYGYGGDKAIEAIKPWQAVSGFEAGRCAETQIRAANAQQRPALIADAKKFYTYVLEKHPTSEYAAKAKQRLADLAKLAN